MHSECGRICRVAVGEGGLMRGGILAKERGENINYIFSHFSLLRTNMSNRAA